MKKKILTIAFISIAFLSYFSYDFIKSAREDRTWPFNSNIGNYLPEFVKYYAYLITNPEEKALSSNLEKIKLNYYQIPSKSATGGGGGIEAILNNKILVTLDNGEMFIFDQETETFFTNSSNLKNNYSGIRDTFINEELSEFLILATVNTEGLCKKIKLDSFQYVQENDAFRISNPETIWESEEECEAPTNSAAGGRIVFFQDDYFISTGFFSESRIGDLEGGMHPYPQSEKSSFGKVIKIDRSRKNEPLIYSLGHRTPQGLFVSNDKKKLFLTEHGPKAGDELNLIVEGKNYGWPCKTDGRMYGFPDTYPLRWPEELEILGCSDQDFTEPMFASKESIGISQGLQYKGKYFEKYNDDLIIGTLIGASIFILSLQEERIVIKERIRIGERIRDIFQTKDERIAIYTDGGSLAIVSKNE
jgi:hypothetical protein